MTAVNDRKIPFIEASGCGNAFLIVQQSEATPEERSSVSVRLCGPGADGVEWIAPSTADDADVDAVLINADGSEAELSGNGTRCVAAHWVAANGGDVVRVRTGAGVKQCKLTARDGDDFEFETNHGEPQFEGEVEITLPIGKVKGIKLSMGNPQF